MQENYVYDADPWMGILEVTDFAVRSRYPRIKYKIPGKLVFDQDTIIPIKHIADWIYI